MLKRPLIFVVGFGGVVLDISTVKRFFVVAMVAAHRVLHHGV